MSLGVDEVTLFLYQLALSKDYRGTIIDYFNDAVKRDYIDLGWKFGKYYNVELDDFLDKIIDPSGKEILLPLE